MRLYFVIITILSSGLVSCEYFKTQETKQPVARVNDSYLFKEDLQSLIQENTTAQDSALIVSNYINRWATQQLLIEKAKVNLSQEQLDVYDQLVQDYKNDLYTKGYKTAIVTRQLDSTISQFEYEQYYEQNKESFALNERLLKLRYINLVEENSNINTIKRQLQRFNQEDVKALEAITIQFKKYFLNDSTWVKQDALAKEIPLIAVKTNAELLKNSNYVQLQDSLGVYLIQVKETLERNQIAPLAFVKPTIEQIILNKRKLELIKQLEADITKDAIKNNDFEVYQ